MEVCSSSKQFLFLSLILFSNMLFVAVSQHLRSCLNNDNYTSNSTYQRNLNTVLWSLPSNTNGHGFYNSFIGSNSDRVCANALCRVDLDLDGCRNCINDGVSQLRQFCSSSKNAVIWPADCSIRYSTEDMTGLMTDSPKLAVVNTRDVQSRAQFNQVLRSLLESLRDRAASGGSLSKFAIQDVPGPGFMTIYGLVQCTPDLSEDQCKQCLQGLIGYIGQCCTKNVGGIFVNPSCKLRFEDYPYFNESEVVVDAPPPDTASEQTPPPPDTGTVVTGKKAKETIIVIVAVAASLSFLIPVFLVIFLRRKKHKKQNEEC